MRPHCRLTIAFMGAFAFAGTATTTFADQGPGSGLGEIVVTAQKRAESVQSVPLSMTTFGGAALEEKAIADFFD